MTDRPELEALFLAHLAWVRQAAAACCRRHRMDVTDVEDFTSWAVLRLLENDYAVLGKFRGESSLRTYLAVVLATLLREYRVQCWGRWRPSAAARRAGPVAMRLEALVHRDGYPLRQAVQVVRLTGETARSERELVTLFASLPPRAPRGECELRDDVPDPRAVASADGAVLAEAALDEERRAAVAIANALAALPPEDRVIVQMRFWDDMTVADIARALGLSQKPLYRRLARLLRLLRRSLEGAGISRRRGLTLLGRRVA